jgi:ribonucrease Y
VGDDVSAFEVLVLIILALLLGAIGVAALVVARRPRKTSLTPAASSTASGTPRTDQEQRAPVAGRPTASAVAEPDASSVAGLPDRASAMMAAAEQARADAEDEVRSRRAEMREQRADLERREQRLSDR